MRGVWLLAVALGGIVTGAAAQAAASGSGESRARALLEAAVAAHGGRERFEAVAAVEADLKGQAWMIGQSVRPDGPLDLEPARTITRFHRASGRVRQDVTNDYPPDYTLTFREVAGEAGGFIVEPTRAYQGGRLDRTPPGALRARRATLLRDLGPFLLTHALERATGLGVLEADGAVDRVELDDGGGRLVLRVHRRTHLLDGYEFESQHAVLGRLAHRVRLGGHRRFHGLLLPTTRDDTRNGADARRGRLAWRFSVPTDDSVFAPPASFAAPAPVTTAVAALAPGVHRLGFGDGNHGLAVEFADHLVVVEAPSSSAVSEAMLAELAAAFPSKPVRYVAFTHHHTDHAGGLRAYVARGITILAPEPYRAFVERLASTAYPLQPDSLARAPRVPVVRTFHGRHVLADATRRLELHEIEPNSHSHAMVVAFVPEAGVLYDGDGALIPGDTPVQPASLLMRELVAALDVLEIWPRVATIVNTHAGVVPPARVREALAAAERR